MSDETLSPLWSTPNTPTEVEMVCRRLVFPFHLIDAVGGALTLLLKENLWQQVGTETVEESVEYLDRMWLAMSEGCEVIGEIKMHALSVLPDNWLWCNGNTYQRVDYPELYDVLAANFIIDADNFKIPDYRQRFPFGTAGASTPGAKGGNVSVSLVVANLPPHYHPYSTYLPSLMVGGLEVPNPLNISSPSISGNTGSVGSGTSFSILPSFTFTQYAIVAS